MNGLWGAYRGISLGSRLIEWGTQSPYSHLSYIEARVEKGVMYGPMWEVEATLRYGVAKVNVAGAHHTKGTIVDLYALKTPLTLDQHEKLVYELCREVGKSYDVWGIIGFILREKHETPNRWFCSEIQAGKLAKVGILIQERIAASQISPERFINSPLLKEVGYFIVGEGPKVYIDCDSVLPRRV